MNFEAFLADPKVYIDELAQISNQKPDFGLREQIDEIINSDPSVLEQIPLVSTLGGLQMTAPGTLIRLRCVVFLSLNMEYLYLRFVHDGKFYTPIYQQEIPKEAVPAEEGHPSVERKRIVVSSVPSISQWLVSELTPDLQQPDIHLNLEDQKATDPKASYQEPFQVNAKFLFDHRDKPSYIFDLIGFVDDPAPIEDPVLPDFLDDTFYDSIPNFICLTSLPVKSLFTPVLPSQPSKSEIRALILSMFNTIFEPAQSELLLLWLLGSLEENSRDSQILKGLFSLNFFGVNQETARLLYRLLQFLCTAIIYIPFNIPSLNTSSLRPSIVSHNLTPTPSFAAHESRFIIDETEMEVGTLTQTGIENVDFLARLITNQIFQYNYEGANYEMHASSPVLILSEKQSFLGNPNLGNANIQVVFPIGNVTPSEVNIDPAMLIVVRDYIENTRFTDFTISDEDQPVVSQSILDLLKSDLRPQQNDLHTYMCLLRLNCISYGSSSITPEIIEETLGLFKLILPFIHPAEEQA